MIALALLVAAVGVMSWPPTAVPDRLRALTGRSQQVWTLPVTAVLWAAVPLAGLLIGVGPAAAVGMVVGLAVHRRRKSYRRTARDDADEHLRRALTVMVGETRAGAPMVHACRSAAAELDAASSEVGAALRTMAATLELGGRPDVAGTAEQAGLRRLAEAWTISSKSGVPMAALLESLRADLVARRDFRDRTEAGLAGPRATAMVLAGLPLLGIGLGQLMGAAPLRVLLGSSIGSILLLIGVGLAIAGVLWADAITDRVLR